MVHHVASNSTKDYVRSEGTTVTARLTNYFEKNNVPAGKGFVS